MASFEEKERREEGRKPLWRTSEGRMREVSPLSRREGEDRLTGYEPHPAQEKKDRPREAARLSGSYGDLAVGTDRKKQLTLVVSKRRSREGPAATRDEKALRASGARKMERVRGEFLTNPHDPEQSALAFRSPDKPAPGRMLGQFQRMMHGRAQEVLAEQVPFLDRRPEREALKALGERADDLRARGGAEARAELGVLERRRQALRQSLTEKAAQQRKVRLMLQKAREESKRRAGESEPPRRYWLLTAAPAGEEPPPEEPENTPDLPEEPSGDGGERPEKK